MTNIHVLSPTPPSSTIEEADVTIGKLVSVLNGAIIDNEVDRDGHIYATEGLEYPFWIAIETDRKLLCFFTSYIPGDQVLAVKAERLIALVNDVNGSLILVKFHWSDTMLVGQYSMTFDTRLDPRHFIKMLRRVSEVFASGVDRFLDGLGH